MHAKQIQKFSSWAFPQGDWQPIRELGWAPRHSGLDCRHRRCCPVDCCLGHWVRPPSYCGPDW